MGLLELERHGPKNAPSTIDSRSKEAARARLRSADRATSAAISVSADLQPVVSARLSLARLTSRPPARLRSSSRSYKRLPAAKSPTHRPRTSRTPSHAAIASAPMDQISFSKHHEVASPWWNSFCAGVPPFDSTRWDLSECLQATLVASIPTALLVVAGGLAFPALVRRYRSGERQETGGKGAYRFKLVRFLLAAERKWRY